MKDIYLSVYGNPAQSLSMVEVSESNAPSANEALMRKPFSMLLYLPSRARKLVGASSELSAMSGMVPMYLLMAAFESVAWLKLISSRRNSSGKG